MLPGIYWGDDEAAEILGTYAEVYLREEILAEGGCAGPWELCPRFLDAMAIASGRMAQLTQAQLRHPEIPKETIRRFVQVLEDTMLAFRHPAFIPASRRVTPGSAARARPALRRRRPECAARYAAGAGSAPIKSAPSSSSG